MPATQATDRVLLQAGHSAQFPPYRTGGGGAPGEAAWATDLAAMLAGRLRAAGVEVVCIGAWLVNGVVVQAPALVTDKDYDLFLSLHYDAAIYAQNTGCIVARAANDPLGSLADRFIAIWQRRYPAALGIPLHQERVNPNMTDYYAFRDTTAQTPGVILEHGVGQGLDHATLFGRIDEVARVDAACVLEYLGITVPEEEDDMSKVQELQAQIDQLNGITKTMQEQIDFKDELLQAANSRAGVAEAEVERLTALLTNTDLRTEDDIASVSLTRRGGAVQIIN
jgi:outer membrane murein-binding lipoprotein Lpp